MTVKLIIEDRMTAEKGHKWVSEHRTFHGSYEEGGQVEHILG